MSALLDDSECADSAPWARRVGYLLMFLAGYAANGIVTWYASILK